MMGSLRPVVTRIIGNHTARAGYDLRVVRENFISNGYQGGRLFFDGTYTSPASNSSTAFNANPGNFVLTPDQCHVLGGYTFADNNNRTAWNTDKSNIQPRFGIAYAANSKTVLRGFFFQAEDGIRDLTVTGVQTCALPI